VNGLQYRHSYSNASREYGAFDVFEQEPLDGSHPLLKLDNVLATPHIGYAGKEAYERYIGIAIDQLVAWRNARPINLLNPEAWRRELPHSK
jgi:D-3-phosphoglycerate dehydrogenase